MAQTPAQVRAMIRRDTRELKKLADRSGEVMARRDERLVEARKLGVTTEQMVEDTGLTPMRIRQVAPAKLAPKLPEAEADEGQGDGDDEGQAAEEPEPEPAGPVLLGRQPLTGDELPARYRPGASASITNLVSEYVTDRWSKNQPELATVFVDTRTGEWCSPAGRSGRFAWEHGSARELLTQLPEAVERVYLVGPRPTTPVTYPGGEGEAMRLWFLEEIPGWGPQGGGHYFPDSGAPMGYWERHRPESELHGRQLVVTMAHDWFGQSPYTVAEAASAWAVLRVRIRAAFGEGAILMTTPATTGRDLWRRSIGLDKNRQPKVYPVLSAELRELIQSTTGQGRREVIAEGPQEIGEFVQYDMRFAYSALSWGMPVGEPTMVTTGMWDAADAKQRDRYIRGRGRWLVTATVPHDWRHIGILPAPGRPEWAYPRTPGQTFTSWVTGTELELALAHGWAVTVHEGMHFRDENPLNNWRDKLVPMYRDAEASEWGRENPRLSKLVRNALRNLVLMTIGAFATRTHMVTRHAPYTDEAAARIPDTSPARIIGGKFWEWQEEGRRSEWTKRLDHPEWAAEMWGRCRGRLLSAPAGPKGSAKVGALHLPPGTVLGMRTDALYLSTDPGWPDDGEMGRLRLESKLTGPFARPQDDADISALKELAQ